MQRKVLLTKNGGSYLLYKLVEDANGDFTAQVVNGEYTLKVKNGSVYFGQNPNGFPFGGSAILIEVPDTFKGDYNSILNWASRFRKELV